MSKGMRKTTFREIKSSFGRYMAILMIIALGVGFFCGLKGTYEAMIYTADEYWKSLNFYDYRLVSTVGFDENIEEKLHEQEDIQAVEGVKSADVLMMIGEDEKAVKMMALPKEINQLMVTAGRLPENENECVLDDDVFGEEAIGTTITLSESNEDDAKDRFAIEEFEAVSYTHLTLPTMAVV